MDPAIGRTTGKLSVDPNGIARYTVKVEVPSGIGQGNEPDLSLAYAQGNPNNILGYGWALGGLSSIRSAQSSMPYDDPNVPQDYDRASLRYALDGQELLAINGPQGAKDTMYVTEVNEYERRISHLGTGFLVLGQAGARTEYGTTPDSCILSSNGRNVKEWRIKRQMDIHGNCVTYNYIQQPIVPASAAAGLLPNLNTSYVDSIVYTSNNVTGAKGMHQISFEYKPRPDPVVQTILGDKVVIGSLLSAIRISVATFPSPTLVRSYELEYNLSPNTGVSCLRKVWESAQYRTPKHLLPTEFTYTSTPSDKVLYELDRDGIQTLQESADNVALMPLDITGRAMTDMTCLRYQQESQTLSLKTFLASCHQSSQNATVTWKPSTGEGAEATLPHFPLGEGLPQPSLLTADLNGDGRNDIIIPFRQSDGFLGFSLSQSTGTGFLDHQVKETHFEWSKESEFIASDVNGDGRTDVIEIFPDQGQLTFRIFTTVTEQGVATLKDARQISTTQAFGQTIQWLQVQTQRNGAKNLVRIHSADNPESLSYTDLFATTFSLEEGANEGNNMRDGKQSCLGTFENDDTRLVSIVACDINGDGVQDLLVCLNKSSGGGETTDWNFVVTTMLNDGNGAFVRHGEPFTKTYSIPTNQIPTNKARFYTPRRNGADYPTLAYVYQEGGSKDFVSLDFQGSCSGFVQVPQLRKIARYADLPGDQEWTISAADLTGHGLGDWLVYGAKNDTYTVCPVYNRGGLTDHLASIRDPMGLFSEIEYKPLADPQVYNPGVAWDQYTPSEQRSEYTLLAASSYVVSSIKTTNDPTINAIPYYSRTEKSYRRAVVDVRGRGWQGFQKVISYDVTSDTTTTETYTQQWPLSGQLSGTTIASGKPDAGQVLQVEIVKYEARTIKLGPWTTFRPLKVSQQLDAYDGGRVARSAGCNYTYDALGNVILDHTWSSTVQPLYTRFAYRMFMDVVALPIRKKQTSRFDNTNLDVYETGDYSLMHADYNYDTGLLKSMSHWSTDANAFTTATFQFDGYGNEVQLVDGVGLQITTVYDEMYHCLPVKRSEIGRGVNLLRMAAYDAVTRAMVVVEDADGAAKFMLADAWARCREIRKRATSADKESLKSARECLGDTTQLIGDPGFLQRALEMSTVPDQSMDMVCGSSKSGRRYIFGRNTTHFSAGSQGQAETIEVVDCVGNVRKKSTRNGNYDSAWRYTEDDARGCRIIESFPFAPVGAGISSNVDVFDWIPQSRDCVVSTYDHLRRLVTQTKGSHSDDSTLVTMRRSYADGGAKQQTTVVQENPKEGTTVLSSNTEHFLNINGEERLAKKVDELGRETLFEYDLLGKLTKITDPAGKTETREWSSGNQITKTSDAYRNTVTRSYDLSNHLTQVTDALGQKITYVRDAKGRPMEQRGEDGRTLQYEYDQSGRDWVVSIRTTASNTGASSPESRFDFQRDERGRLTKQTVTCEGLESFTVDVAYDWQDQITQKTLPDHSVMTCAYGGSLLASTGMKGEGWKVNADYQRYNAADKPEKWTINNHGSVSQSFANEIKYDKMCFPVSHTLSAGSTTVQNHYMFNGLNQLAKVHEFSTGETADYKYQSGRLVSYQEDSSAVLQYAYDLSGNMTKSNDIEMKSDGSSLRGTRNGGEHFSISYDRCGRMIRRSTPQAQFEFKYNTFGTMSSMINKAASGDGGITQIISDYAGHTLVKKQLDGTREIYVDPAYTVLIRPDGSRQLQRKWRGQDRLLATIRSEIPTSSSAGPTLVNLYYTDTKGNVTHIYKSDGGLDRKLRYDPFGGLANSQQLEPHEKGATYESNPLDLSTMMYDFAARWYDPLACRFATADDILDEKSAKRSDGINRHAFENNDPVNYIDPTGHWSWSSILGVIIGVALVVASVAISIATAGVASPLAMIAFGALTGALMTGGINAITYSLEHKNETDAGKFWKGYGATVAIGMAIGAVTGAFTAGVGCATAVKAGAQAASRLGSAASMTWSSVGRTAFSLGSRALASGLSAVVNKIGSNMVERDIYGRTDIDYDSGLGTAFGIGMLSGLATNAGKDIWSGGLKQSLGSFFSKAGPGVSALAAGFVAAHVTLASMPAWHKLSDEYGYVGGDGGGSAQSGVGAGGEGGGGTGGGDKRKKR